MPQMPRRGHAVEDLTRRFLFLTDLHYGYERRSRRKVALHDPHALSVALQFAQDFRPHVVILGGDILDCGAISHHNRGKVGALEGLRLLQDARECRAKVLAPLETLGADQYIYLTGNHEDWLNDLTDELPGLEGLVSIQALLSLGRWTVVPQGASWSLGKLTFIHGDQISGGEYAAKAAVLAYERSIRFGHFHSFQTYTKTSALDLKIGKSGMGVPCLCTKGPKYGEGKPNRWCQGFLYGYVRPNGTFHDYPVVIVNRRAIIHGKDYGG